MIESEQIKPVKKVNHRRSYYEKYIEKQFNQIFDDIILRLGSEDKYLPLKEKCVQTFMNIWRQIKKGTKYRTPEKLGPVVIYMFLKLKKRGFNQSLSNFLKINDLNRKEFLDSIKHAVACYPSYYKRDRRENIYIIIKEVKEFFKFDSNYIKNSQDILKKIWPFIKNTKEEVIAGVVCILTMMIMDIDDLPYVKVCRKIGIEMSSVQYQVKNKIFRTLHIPGFISLKRSCNIIKKVIEDMK